MKSLFLRIFLWFCGATMAIGCVVAAGFMLESRGVVATNWRELAHSAVLAAGRMAIERYESGGQAAAERHLDRLGRDMDLQASLIDPSGRRIGGGPVPDPALLARVRARPEGELSVFPLRGMAGVALRSPAGKSYVFLAALPPREWSPSTGSLLTLFVLTGCLLCYLLARHLSSPVVQLRAVTSRFSLGELSARVTSPQVLRRDDEIGGLARDFNQMASRIETLMKAQRRLIADASHELTSPITRLSLALGLLRRSEADVGRSLVRMEREVERLKTLISQLLTLSRLECIDQPPPMQVFDLAALTREVAADAEFEAASFDRSVQLTECDACTMRGAPELVRSAIENAVRNAIRYTRTSVAVRLQRDDAARTATITVEDDGPGVPEAQLAHIFDAFYRVDETRERYTGGAGLGLAITHQVVMLHGGSVAAANRSHGGLELRMVLPAE